MITIRYGPRAMAEIARKVALREADNAACDDAELEVYVTRVEADAG